MPSSPKCSLTVGRLVLASTRATPWPVYSAAAAMLAARVLLPSRVRALVMTTDPMLRRRALSSSEEVSTFSSLPGVASVEKSANRGNRRN